MKVEERGRELNELAEDLRDEDHSYFPVGKKSPFQVEDEERKPLISPNNNQRKSGKCCAGLALIFRRFFCCNR